MKPIAIEDDLLVRLASGPADDETLGILQNWQICKHRLLMTHLATDSPHRSAAAVSLLSQVEVDHPKVATQLFIAPIVGAWASLAARRTIGRVKPDPASSAYDASYLDALAVVAALRTGLVAEFTLLVREGIVLFPTLGGLRVDLPDGSALAVRVGEGRARLITAEREIWLPDDLCVETKSWLPVRSITAQTAGQRLSIAVEDLDYNRDCYGKTVSKRMSKEDFLLLPTQMQRAWELIVMHAPARARELSAGLRCMVPLSPTNLGPGLSATSGTAYGALGLTLPESAEELAVTLVHEFQHSKLSALLGVIPLYDVNDDNLYFAAWKKEPRPVWGLLQGAYAFLAVSDFWRCLYEAGECRPVAERNFGDLRVQVDNVITTLETACHLNADGQLFVRQMRLALDQLQAVSLPIEVEKTARSNLARIYQQWERRNTAANLRR